ncbi:MAG: hypothetical protein Q7R22_003470 [Verrucomicrobiota bacterium JB025]|nr:hypothetical protein [Verrucomicrobiota bacterium JB025]
MKFPIQKVAAIIPVTGLMLLTTGIGAEMRDRITPEELLKRKAAGGGMDAFQKPNTPDPRVKSPATPSIINESILLSDGNHWTLVPKGSVLHLPEKQKHHVVTQPTGTFTRWSEFLKRNISWLSAESVSMDTATGKNPISTETTDAWPRRGAIVIAVHRGGAISVKPPAVPEPPKS